MTSRPSLASGGTLADDLLGVTLDGRYRIERRLGAGAMGTVYAAEHTGTGRRVAVKVIQGDRPAQSEQLLVRFQREARSGGRIDSVHIAQVLDTGVDPRTGTPFLVMELLAGEDLADLIKRLGALPAPLALRVASQTLRGLARAHQAGVVHRDIKPANLFLARTEEGTRVVKILDFGIAKDLDPLDAESRALTSTGALIGSPLYASPEQMRQRKQLDHRTDLWSLGVVLFEMLARTTPFADAESIADLILSVCSTPAPWLQDVAAWVPAEAAAIVQRALAIDPDQRFRDAESMLAAVSALLDGSDVIHEAMLVPVEAAPPSSVAPRAPRLASGQPPASELAPMTGRGFGSTLPISSGVTAPPSSGVPVTREPRADPSPGPAASWASSHPAPSVHPPPLAAPIAVAPAPLARSAPPAALAASAAFAALAAVALGSWAYVHLRSAPPAPPRVGALLTEVAVTEVPPASASPGEGSRSAPSAAPPSVGVAPEDPVGAPVTPASVAAPHLTPPSAAPRARAPRSGGWSGRPASRSDDETSRK